MIIIKTILLIIYIMVFKNIGNWFNKNAKVSSLIESKIVLYFLVFISILNLYMYAMDDDLVYALIMIIVGFLSSFFNKNMIIILFTAIAVTNLIRFSVDKINRIEGFTNSIGQLDSLMDHLTNGVAGGMESNEDKTPPSDETEKVDEKPKESPPQDGNNVPVVPQDMIPNKNAILNKDPSKRDEEIDKFIKKLNLDSALKNMEGQSNIFNVNRINLVKEKTENALKYTSQIANSEQRKGVESILNLQNRLMEKVLSLAPLIDEFREVVKSNTF